MIYSNSWTQFVTKLIVHPATTVLLNAYLQRPAHASCLVGQNGMGLGTLARELASRVADSGQPQEIIQPDDKGLIAIDRIRELYRHTRTTAAGRRPIIIDDADSMSLDAQHAFLKLLEEPASHIYFILTSHSPDRLLPTVRSRLQVIPVRPISSEQSAAALDTFDLSETERRQTLFLAAGRPAELIRLASDDGRLAEQGVIVGDARTFLSAGLYERLALTKRYTDRAAALQLLAMCAELLKFSLLKQAQAQNVAGMAHLETAMTRIQANGHVRTHLMWLAATL
jgi:DNA polymerase-3 subunit delta'